MNYIGLYLIILSLVVAKTVDFNIKGDKTIILDFNKREVLVNEANMQILHAQSKRGTKSDQILIQEILSISQNLNSKNNETSNEKMVRNYLDSLQISYSKNESIYAYLNLLTQKILDNRIESKQGHNCQILVSNLEQLSSDSIDITVKLFNDYKGEGTVRFEYDGKPISKSELKTFNASLESLTAITTNPVTGQTRLIKRK